MIAKTWRVGRFLGCLQNTRCKPHSDHARSTHSPTLSQPRFLSTMKKWILVNNFNGEPKEEDLQLEEEVLPDLKNGDVLLEGKYWSVDPYMRPLSDELPPGSMMAGQHLAKVVESRNTKYPTGEYLLVNAGWRSHTVCNPDKLPEMVYHGTVFPAIARVSNTGDLPKHVALNPLGMPGATAYFGFLDICKPKAGETVLVTGAAGGVGSLVGQIAKIKGCKVIGFAGTETKVQFLKDLGFDFAFNYKEIDVNTALEKAAPEGIDCYFDNVGGEFSSNVLIHHMNKLGRVSLCGSISRYNDGLTDKLAQGPELFPIILTKSLVVQGFIIYREFHRFPEAHADILKWIREGKLQYREHMTDGFENMRSAFYGMLKGENTGKAIVQKMPVTNS